MDVGGADTGYSMVGGGAAMLAYPGTDSYAAIAAPTAPLTTAQVRLLTTVNSAIQQLLQATAGQQQLGAEGSTFEQRVLELLNAERAAAGLGSLRYSAQLDQAATAHNGQQEATESMAHEGIGDGDPESRIRATGFAGAWGENVAVGQTSPEQVVQEWMASPGHRRNILDPTYTQVGNSFGMSASGRTFWAQSFGT